MTNRQQEHPGVLRSLLLREHQISSTLILYSPALISLDIYQLQLLCVIQVISNTELIQVISNTELIQVISNTERLYITADWLLAISVTQAVAGVGNHKML